MTSIRAFSASSASHFFFFFCDPLLLFGSWSINININVRGVLPQEVAQAVEVPTTLEATELGRGM